MNKKTKILYIITKSVWGGAGKYVYDLAINLPKDRFEVFVAAGGRGKLAEELIKAGISYFEIKNFQRDISIIKEILAYAEILKLLLKLKPNIIHVNSSKAGGVAGAATLDYRFLTFNFGVKTIFTAHGWAFHENRPKWQFFLIRLFTRLTAFLYSKIICVSEFDRLSAIKNRIAPAKKLITIHNGIKIEDYHFLSKEESRKIFGLTMSELVVGTVGEFTKNKGQKYLIEAVKKLRDSGHILKTILIGWGEEKSNLKSQISNLNLENNVFLIENLVPAAPYLKAFDVFVLPSLKEGLPYTILEAGLAELPIIATRVGGIPEIIGYDEGILINAGNSDELAKKIKELINNPEKGKKITSNLRQKILDEFSLDKMLTSTLAAYE